MTEKLEPFRGNVMLFDRCLENWQAIRWHRVHRRVSQLRQRIYRLKYRNHVDAKTPDTHLEARVKPNCQEGSRAFWEKRQCFGT